ncbi:MAG: DUF2155 domain-containing protein [Pseudomonadota bacterium]|nr:DUF2155 domain-containing protein [Pseudomonadota bacterium]
MIRNSSGFGLVVALFMSSVDAQEIEPLALPVPPPVPLILDQESMTPEFDRSFPPSAAPEVEDDGTLSVFDVPLLEIPNDAEAEQEEVSRIGSFSLLNKVTAKLRPVELMLGEPTDIGSLRVIMRDCISTPPEEPPETKVFLEVFEYKSGFENRVFSGWMFASSPGINGLEHAVYDLWPTACKTSTGERFTGIR